jgi:hypothetical protein
MLTSHIIYCTALSPLDVQPDDDLLEAETCSWLAVTIIHYIYIYIYIYNNSCVLTFKRLLFNFVILTNTMGISLLKDNPAVGSNRICLIGQTVFVDLCYNSPDLYRS